MEGAVLESWMRPLGLMFCVALVLLVMPDLGMAQDLQPINEISEYIEGFLTGRLATSMAVIAVAIVGYLFWVGRVEATAALGVVAGIAIVFGASQIVSILEAVAR